MPARSFADHDHRTRHDIELVARVEAVDAGARTVTLQGPNQTVTLSVKDDVDLNTVKKGDMVKADFVESFAVNVTENYRYISLITCSCCRPSACTASAIPCWEKRSRSPH